MKKYVNRKYPSTTVEFVCEAEYRVAEMKQAVVIYTRNTKYYVRNKVEFEAKFRPAD
jgi:hypothetical protein